MNNDNLFFLPCPSWPDFPPLLAHVELGLEPVPVLVLVSVLISSVETECQHQE